MDAAMGCAIHKTGVINLVQVIWWCHQIPQTILWTHQMSLCYWMCKTCDAIYQSINQSVYSFREQDKKARGTLTVGQSTTCAFVYLEFLCCWLIWGQCIPCSVSCNAGNH